MADDTLERPEKMTIPVEISICARILPRDWLTSQEHLPRLEVEELQHVVEDTDEYPVKQGQEHRTSDGVVSGCCSACVCMCVMFSS
jgi:hypothetical protein